MGENDLVETIEEAAKAPAEVEIDGQSVKQHRLTDLIEADRYLKSTTAASKVGLGVKRTIVNPPGAV